MVDNKKIRDVLNYDSLHEAEKLTGESYKESEITQLIGLSNHINNSKKKREMLESIGDSTFSNTEENYLKIVESIGFESVLVEPFINDEGVEERLHVMWNKEFSILLVFDTFSWKDDGSFSKAGREVPKPSVNGGTFYYCWVPNTNGNHCVSSGGYISNGDGNKTYSSLFNLDLTPHFLPEELRVIEPKWDNLNYETYSVEFKDWCDKVSDYINNNNLIRIWQGSHDCREAIKFNISQLSENGEFIKKWPKTPFLWLLHYMDTKTDGYDHKKITEGRLNKLPKYVIDCILT